MNLGIVLYLVAGIVLALAGWVYTYRVRMIFKINQFFKSHIFNDAVVLGEHRKIGLFLLFLSAIVLYLGFSKIQTGKFQGNDTVQIKRVR